MTDNTRPKRTHHRLAGLGAAAAALALTVTLAPTGPASAGPGDTRGPDISATQGRPVEVMTRNLYLGAGLTPVITALASGDQTAIVAAATQTWAAVQATRPEERMAAIADEIAEERPAVVGLQEVTTWTTYDFNPVSGQVSNPHVAYEFLDLLLEALADRGVVYHEVEGATAENFASPPIPILASPTATFPTKALSLLDRDVILRRDDVKTSNARTGQFRRVLTLPLPPAGPDGDLPVKRGWGSVDVRTNLADFRFVDSHLEAFGIPGVDAEGLRVLQVQELLAAQAAVATTSGDLPTVYVGDYNSDAPSGDAYTLLVSSVGSDAWTGANPDDPRYTCCFDANVRGGTLDSRIDLVAIDDQVKAKSAEVIGEEMADMTPSGLWPSDHAGVVARLVIGQSATPKP